MGLGVIELVIWKDVEGFEGLYKVSNEGVVISTPRNGAKGKVMKQYDMKRGYRQYDLRKNGKRHHAYVHRLIAIHFIANPENKPFVNHIDGNKLNNNIENLEWVTSKENMQHAAKIGLIKSGENHPDAKLTDQEVREIRDLYKHKIYLQWELSEIYGVNRSTMNWIVHNKHRKAAGN